MLAVLIQKPYDASQRRTGTTYPNGVTLSQSYDDAGTLASIVGRNGAGTTLSSFTYTYRDTTANQERRLRQRVTDKDGNVTAFTYDPANRLVRAQTTGGPNPRDEQVAYDGAGNRTSRTVDGSSTTYNYNDANQLTGLTGGPSFTYDANGNLTGSSAGLSLSYNAKDQTSSVTPAGGSALSMGYTGASQVQRVQVGSATQRYSVLGLTVSTDTGGSTSFTRDEQGVLLGMRAPGGQRYYYLYDGLGNVAAVTDSAGAVVATYRYSPYGETITSTGTLSNPYRFGGSYGAYTDVSTGLLKLGQRFYDSSLGRWTQQDPLLNLQDPLQWNRYGYVAGNPVNLIDPSGTSHLQALINFFTAVAFACNVAERAAGNPYAKSVATACYLGASATAILLNFAQQLDHGMGYGL